MNPNTLFPHNLHAYNEIMQHFNEGHQKACVVHATGTGKSYIINAVSDHFERVLIITTNMFTIDQVRDTIKAESPERITEPTYMIYQALLQQMRDDVNCSQAFDLIVFDEFHHGGAEEWGKAVNWIIEQNPSAKVLGTSATAIRHSDGGRDMGDELFDGNVVSTLSLGEAWARKVLMAPVYIMAIEDSEEFYNKFIKKIDESPLLEDKKATYRRMAAELKEQYEMDGKAPDIIRKWLPSDSKRIIVFSKNIEEAKENVSKVKNWMAKAGFTIHGVYLIHSKMSLDERKAQMNAFQNDEFRGIKLMVAVDILNEGVHVPRVDAVFMLRKTGSPTIHLQQMGRCMGTYKGNGRRPVIFDFRNNVVNTRKGNIDNFFTKEKEDYDRVRKEENEISSSIEGQLQDFAEQENFPSGNNYTWDLALMIDRFSADVKYQDEWGLLEDYVQQAEDYYIVYGRKIPNRGDYQNIYGYLMKFWKNEKRRAERPDVVERLNKCGFDKEDLLMIRALQAEQYYIEHGKKISRKKGYHENYGYLMEFLRDEKRRVERPDVVEILQRSGFEKEDVLIERVLQAEDYYIKHGEKIPSSNDGLYYKIYSTIMAFLRDEKRRAERPDVVERLSKCGFQVKVKKDELLERVLQAEKYYIKYGKKIPYNGVYRNTYSVLHRFLKDEKRRMKRPELVEILQRSGFEDK